MATDDGKDITKAPRRNARSLRETRSDWVNRVYRTLNGATQGEAARLGRKQVSPASRVSMLLTELARLWRRAPSRSVRVNAGRLNKLGPVGFPPEPSGLEATAGSIAAVLWAAQLTRENELVPEQLSPALERPLVVDEVGVPQIHAAEFLSLLQRSLDRRVLAMARAEALHEVARLPQRVVYGPLPDLPPGQRLWVVTVASLVKDGGKWFGHRAIALAAGRSLSWSEKMPAKLGDLVVEQNARGPTGVALSPKGRAWIKQHRPDLA